MTRFWITLEQGVNFVIKCLKLSQGGELFVPKIPSMKIIDLAKTIAPDCEYEIVGIRPGEKLHEIMVSEDDARRTLEFDDYFIIEPSHDFFSERLENNSSGKSCLEGFQYSSDKNDLWLQPQELSEMLDVNEKV